MWRVGVVGLVVLAVLGVWVVVLGDWLGVYFFVLWCWSLVVGWVCVLWFCGVVSFLGGGWRE